MKYVYLSLSPIPPQKKRKKNGMNMLIPIVSSHILIKQLCYYLYIDIS